MARDDLNLLQGTLDVLVLQSLLNGPRHGYTVASWIRDTSGNALHIEDGALYTALHRMEKRKWLSSEWGLSENNRKAKYYRLTKLGRGQLDKRARVWKQYSTAVSRVLSANTGET